MNEIGSPVVTAALPPPVKCPSMPVLSPDPGLRAVADRLPDPVLIADDDRCYVYANAAAEAFFGFPVRDILGRKIEDFTPPDIRNAVAANWSKFLSDGAQQGNFPLLAADGTVKHVEFSAVANFRPGLHISFLKDRTAAQRAEKAREESERMARLALGAGRMGHFAWDNDKQAFSCSETVERLWGLTTEGEYDERDRYRRMLEHVDPGDRTYVRQRLRDTLLFGYECELEFRVAGDDGSLSWVTLRAQTMFDRDGKRCGLLGICWDTTQAKDSERALRHSEVRFRTLLEQSPLSMQLFDPSGACLLANRACHEFWGSTAESRTGYNIREDRRMIALGLQPAIERAFAGEPVELPVTAYQPDSGPYHGEEIWLRGFMYPVHDDDGDLREVVLIQENVTQTKLLEQARSRQMDELMRSNSELERFAYGASHDLREPLRNTLAFAELLKSQSGKLDSQQREYLGYIVSGAQRMSSLIDSLLEYSRASVQRDLLLVRSDLNELLHQAIENLRTTIEQTGARISCEPMPTLHCAPLGIVQLFQNLIGNAIKYAGGKTPEIRISARELNDSWEVSVQDSGIGIAPCFHDEIFGVFRRLHGREQPGSGLGLAICTAVVEKHGGRIWVESEEGKGATFRFTLAK